MIDRLDPLPPLGAFVGELMDLVDPSDPAGLERITVDMPIECDLLSGGGAVLALGASPPTQRIETSLLPVFHRLRVTLAALSDAEADDAGSDA
ncbi:hypothetical protein FHS95_002805 [Sphingomonas naasensis]|uniref:Uncharacterized protein n=1 Tax=Sphingomonas naasensis TaxID=1344951 RepID=A0A4S1W6G8_9SPHN|nr:hypothetical protein [Sphingomonas naasensis]NIJ21102.1 hypothetical protein [Sphingomonas naasensis]TGX38309.1 hypothetical protein E5A74_19095 [Sphingomonas naasensis]